MFVSFLKERAQQLNNIVEKLTAVTDLERLKYKFLKTWLPVLLKYHFCPKVLDLQQDTQSQQVPSGEQPTGHSTHHSEPEFVLLSGFTHMPLLLCFCAAKENVPALR